MCGSIVSSTEKTRNNIMPICGQIKMLNICRLEYHRVVKIYKSDLSLYIDMIELDKKLDCTQKQDVEYNQYDSSYENTTQNSH